MDIDEERIEMPWDDPIRTALHRESASNAFAEARCPRCDAPMRLRYGRNGVVFVCGCAAIPISSEYRRRSGFPA